MQARSGGRIRIQSNAVGAGERQGTVLDTRSSGAMVVRWDDGRETIYFPGSDARFDDDETSSGPTSSHDATVLGCHIELEITESDDECMSVATLMTRRGSFQAQGMSRRNPGDPNVPLIGEELAIARSLHSLAEHLESEAADAIDRHEQHTGHLI